MIDVGSSVALSPSRGEQRADAVPLLVVGPRGAPRVRSGPSDPETVAGPSRMPDDAVGPRSGISPPVTFAGGGVETAPAPRVSFGLQLGRDQGFRRPSVEQGLAELLERRDTVAAPPRAKRTCAQLGHSNLRWRKRLRLSPLASGRSRRPRWVRQAGGALGPCSRTGVAGEGSTLYLELFTPRLT